MLKVAAAALAALVATTACAMRPLPDSIPMGNVIDMRGEIGLPDLRPAAASPAIRTSDYWRARSRPRNPFEDGKTTWIEALDRGIRCMTPPGCGLPAGS